MGADIAKLGDHAPEEGVLAAEGLVDVAGSRDGQFRLVGHVGVGDFRDWGEEEDDGEKKHEDCDAQINPLD